MSTVEGFNYDNIFIRMLNRLGDAMILSLLTVIGCIPIVTAGASITACYYAALKGIEGEDGYIFRNYKKSFKQNFKQSTAAWLICILAIFVLVVDIYYWKEVGSSMEMVSNILLVVSTILLSLCVMVMLYIFPIISKFENKLSKQFSNSFALVVNNFPKTILMIIVLALVAYLYYYAIVLAIVGFALIGWGIVMYFFAFLMNGTFKKYLPKNEVVFASDSDIKELNAEDEETSEDDNNEIINKKADTKSAKEENEDKTDDSSENENGREVISDESENIKDTKEVEKKK